MREFLRSLRIISLALLTQILIISYALAANYPLEIIQPRAGLTTGILADDRFYKAYPHLEYNVKVAVIGGAYPFTYSLTTAPAGMIINPSTGVISWPDPSTITADNCNTAPGCDVTVRVSDAEGSFTTVSWNVKVTVTNFIFIDSTSGNDTNTGTQLSPLKTINGWYKGAKGNTFYAHYFVYYSAGTYLNNTPILSDLQMNVPSTKPAVHLCITIGGCIIDWQGHNGIHPDTESNYMYWDGFYFKNAAYWDSWFEIGTNVTFRRNTFDAPTQTGAGIAGTNPSGVFLGASTCGQTLTCTLVSITENTFKNRPGYGVLLYQWYKGLISDNTFDSFSNPALPVTVNVIGYKGAPRRWDTRNNVFTNISGGGSLHNIESNSNVSMDNEIRFNLVKNTSGQGSDIAVDNSPAGNCGAQGPGPWFIYRNTFMGGSIIFHCVTTGNGPFNFYDNVVQSTNFTVQCQSCTSTVNTHSGHNLLAASGLVNTDGTLVNSGNLGGFGFQTALALSPPTSLAIQ